MVRKAVKAAPATRTPARPVLPSFDDLSYEELDEIFTGTGVDVLAPNISMGRRFAAVEWWVRRTVHGEDTAFSDVLAHGRLADVDVASRGKAPRTTAPKG